MRAPLMPKATAVWLVENTALTFDQIADFCGLHPLEVQAIADGEVANQMQGLDPVANGQTTADELGPWFYTAAIAVPARTSRLEYFIEASDETGKQSSFPAAGSQPVAVITGGDVEPPLVIHRPVTSAPAGKPLAIVAQVQDPSGVKWVRLRYRNVNQQEDYRTLPMLPAGRRGQYQAVVPAESLSSKWDFMYLIEVMDNQGNGRIYPDFNKETPYVVVRLARSKMAPQMRADAGGR